MEHGDRSSKGSERSTTEPSSQVEKVVSVEMVQTREEGEDDNHVHQDQTGRQRPIAGLHRRMWRSIKAFPRRQEPESDSDTSVEEKPAPVQVPKHRYLPIISGLVCPFSVLLDIPGLTERWYVKTLGYQVVETQPNPIILDVGQAVSMAFGVMANVALIVRFLERHTYVSTWAAMISLTIHDIINLVIVLTFGIVHRIDDGFTYGDAFWMTVAATAASLLCNVTLVVDYVRVKDFRHSGSGLTEKQRSLVIAVMILLCYIGLGSLCFSFLISELTYIDSLYFTIVTISTVGFGDITPGTAGSRVFSIFYDIVGIVLLGFTIAIGRETIIETFEASYRSRRDALAKKAKERKEEKRQRLKRRREQRERELRERLESEGHSREHAQAVVEQEMQQPLESLGIRVPSAAADGTRPAHIGGGRSARSRHHQLSAATQQMARNVGQAQRELVYEYERQQGMSYIRARARRILRLVGLMKNYTPPPTELQEDGEEANVGLRRTNTEVSAWSSISQEEKFVSFRRQLQAEQRREFHLKLAVALALFIVFWTVGAAVFQATESWTYFEALWFCFVFFTTIGYGDFSPKSSAGRAFFIAWSLFGISVMTLTISVCTETWSSRFKSSIEDSQTRRMLSRTGRKRREANLSKLLASEGFNEDEEVQVKDLPAKLMQAVRGFHDHARFYMLGSSGEPPERFRNLITAAGELDEELARAVEDGGLSGAADDAKHFLFMISYERQFDAITDAAEQLSSTFERHQRELDEMRELNQQLRDALTDRDARGSTADVEEEQQDEDQDESIEEDIGEKERELNKPSVLPFIKRPPGGFGDEPRERKIVREVDQDVDVPDGSLGNQAQAQNRNRRQSNPRRPSACAALDESNAMLDKLEEQEQTEGDKVAYKPTALTDFVLASQTATGTAATSSGNRPELSVSTNTGRGESPAASPVGSSPASSRDRDQRNGN